jgi:hypothetical protein
MNAEELRSLQAPLKERYRQRPQTALITLRAEGRLGEGVTCKIETGKAPVEAGLHSATGGDGLSACSGDMLLEALVGCAGVTECNSACRRRPGLSRHAWSVQGCAGRFPTNTIAIRSRHGCERGATGYPASPDRALLRCLPNIESSGQDRR